MRSCRCSWSWGGLWSLRFLFLSWGMAAASASGGEPPTGAPPAALTPADVAGATIVGVFEAPVRLAAGSWEGAPYVEGGAARPRLVLLEGLVRFGELDGVAGQEAVVLLAESSGGSGERIHLAVVGRRGEEVVSLSTLLVGDRPKIRSFALAGREIVLEVVEAGPDEAMCCPTQLATKVYAFVAGVLRPLRFEVTGRLSLALLAGEEWQVAAIDGEPLPAGVRPPAVLFDGGRIAGFAGCNRFTGTIEETAPGEIGIGPLALTRMACPGPAMEVERRFTASLAAATRWGYVAGRVVLSGMAGETPRAVTLVRD